jgi:AbrB family looped-hinge helix DNA binding protein
VPIHGIYRYQMDRIITIDGAGRLVLPKDVRDRFHLHGGSKLRLVDEGNRVSLEPIGETAPVVEEDGVPVVQSVLAGDWVDHRRLREGRVERLSRIEGPSEE